VTIIEFRVDHSWFSVIIIRRKIINLMQQLQRHGTAVESTGTD